MSFNRPMFSGMRWRCAWAMTRSSSSLGPTAEEEEEDLRALSSSPSCPPCSGGCRLLLGLIDRPHPHPYCRRLGGRRRDCIIFGVFVCLYQSRPRACRCRCCHQDVLGRACQRLSIRKIPVRLCCRRSHTSRGSEDICIIRNTFVPYFAWITYVIPILTRGGIDQTLRV